MKKPDQFNQTLGVIADKINARRRAELLNTFGGRDGFVQEMQVIRDSEAYRHGNKDKSARKIASIPTTYWRFLEDLYQERTGSRKFYQDITFMRENCPEFLTVHRKDL
jgi:hypothetical protein